MELIEFISYHKAGLVFYHAARDKIKKIQKLEGKFDRL
jgi:hypothetical protein